MDFRPCLRVFCDWRLKIPKGTYTRERRSVRGGQVATRGIETPSMHASQALYFIKEGIFSLS
jgi:hypothetical protein